MFGVLRGASCAMKSDERVQWMNHICGVCLALRDECGQTSRVTTNYDSALISVLCEAQQEMPAETVQSTCPLRGSRMRSDVVSPQTVGAKYGAVLALTAGATKIEDHVADGEHIFRYVPNFSRHVAARWQRVGTQAAHRLGFDTRSITAQVAHQDEIESRSGEDFYFYARPTELAMGSAFQHTAVLTSRPHNAPLLYEIGRMFGRIMYLLDAYQDYAEDLARHQFNGLAASVPAAQIKEVSQQVFEQAYTAVQDRMGQLDLPRPTLLRKLLIGQLRQQGGNVLGIRRISCATGGCHGVVREDPLETERRRRRQACCDAPVHCPIDCCECCCGDACCDSCCNESCCQAECCDACCQVDSCCCCG